MISVHPSAWTSRQWLVLVAIIVLLVIAWPKPGPDHIKLRVTNGPTVLSTTTVPLH